MSSRKIKKFSTRKLQLRNFTTQTFKFKSGDICRPQSVSIPLFEDEITKVLKDAKLDYVIEGNVVVVGEEPNKDNAIGSKELDILVADVAETLGELKTVVKARKTIGFSNELLNGEIKALSTLQKSLALQKDGKESITSNDAERVLNDAKKWLMVIVDLTPPQTAK